MSNYYRQDAKLWEAVKIGRSKYRAIGRDHRGIMLWKGSGPTIYTLIEKAQGEWGLGRFDDQPFAQPIAQQFSRLSKEIKQHVRAQQKAGTVQSNPAGLRAGYTDFVKELPVDGLKAHHKALLSALEKDPMNPKAGAWTQAIGKISLELEKRGVKTNPLTRDEANTANRELKCEMKRDCKQAVTHIDDKGFIYCHAHGVQRKGFRPCRQLTPKELGQLKGGMPLASYNPLTRDESNVLLEKGREALDLAGRNLDAGFPVTGTMHAGMAYADARAVETAAPRKYASHHAQGADLRHKAYGLIKPELDREARRSVGLKPNPLTRDEAGKLLAQAQQHREKPVKSREEGAYQSGRANAAAWAASEFGPADMQQDAAIQASESALFYPRPHQRRHNPLVMTVMGNPYTLKGGDKQAIRNIVSRLSVGATEAEAADAVVAKLGVHAPAHVITAVRNYAGQCHRANQKLYGGVARGMNPGVCQNPGHRHGRRNPLDYQDVYSAAQKVGYSIHDAARVASAFKRTGELPRTVEAQLRYFKNPVNVRTIARGRYSRWSLVDEVDAKAAGYTPHLRMESAGDPPYHIRLSATPNPSQAFDVFLDGKHIDTVFYGADVTVDVDEVKRSLVNHDGYDSDIEVKKRCAKSAGPRGPLHPMACSRCGASIRAGSVATATGKRVCYSCADDISTGGQRRNPEGEDVVREWLPVPKDSRKQVYARRVKGTFKEALRHAQERAGRWNTVVLLYEIDMAHYPLMGGFKDVWAIARPHGGYEIVKGRAQKNPSLRVTGISQDGRSVRSPKYRYAKRIAKRGGVAPSQLKAHKKAMRFISKQKGGSFEIKHQKNPGKVTRRKVTMTLEAFAKMVKAKNDPKLWSAFLKKVEAYKKWSHGTLPKKVTVEQVDVPGMSGIWMTYDAGKAPETAYVMPRGTKRKGAWVHQWDTMPDLKNDPDSGIIITKLKGKSRITDFYHR